MCKDKFLEEVVSDNFLGFIMVVVDRLIDIVEIDEIDGKWVEDEFDDDIILDVRKIVNFGIIVEEIEEDFIMDIYDKF